MSLLIAALLTLIAGCGLPGTNTNNKHSTEAVFSENDGGTSEQENNVENEALDDLKYTAYENFDILDEVANASKDDLVMQIGDKCFYIGMTYGECYEKLMELGYESMSGDKIVKLDRGDYFEESYRRNGD